MTSERFDMLLRIAMEELALEEVEFCNSIDPSPLLISEQTQQKVCRMIRLNNIKATFKTGFNVFKKMAVACMLVVTVAFSSAMCIEPVREAFVEAVVTWYEDYIAIHFKVEDIPDGNIRTSPIPNYLPQDWIIELSTENIATQTYNIWGPNDEYIYYQHTFNKNTEVKVDNNTEQVEEILFSNGILGYLTYYSEDNTYNLIWCKEDGIFQLTSFDVDKATLLEIAQSIE